jgi:hypothetical protein
MVTSEEAAKIVIDATAVACERINTFSHEVLRTRGGRLGSGMGSLLEALWGYYVNQVLHNAGGDAAACEIAWLSDHEYNDFACILRDQNWVSVTRIGELFRVEAKSMNVAVDESKGHFDEIVVNIGEWDLLLVLIWSWEVADEFRVYPHIKDFFIGRAIPIALLRDRLHIARGGSFVSRVACLDACDPETCLHHGEPLNASGKRERLSGPETARPSAKVSYAANFGGLVRMLKTGSDTARREFRQIRAEDDVAHDYISFIHRNFPNEEVNQYLASEWKQVARNLGIDIRGLSVPQVIERVRAARNYQDALRNLYPVARGATTNPDASEIA